MIKLLSYHKHIIKNHHGVETLKADSWRVTWNLLTLNFNSHPAVLPSHLICVFL